MSDIHILEANNEGDKFTVAFHLPVPDEDNEAGINYRICISQDTSAAIYPNVNNGSANSEVPDLVQAEKAAMDAGELVEFVAVHQKLATLQDDVAALRARWAMLAAKANTLIRRRYRYWGQTLARE